jgi:DNA-binding transcriptional regulator/RsmH inhibitor MraZ
MSIKGRQSVEETREVATGLLVNTYERPLDPKKRLTVPSVWRHALGSDYVYVMKEEGKPCLQLIPKGVFESRMAGIQEEALSDDELNDVLESVGEDSELLEFDIQGRIRICDRLLEYANLKGPVVMRGAVRMARLWAPENAPVRSAEKSENLRAARKRLRF